MRIRSLIAVSFAAVLAFISCMPVEENLGLPAIKLSESEIVFESEGGSKTVSLAATRDWIANYEAEWVVVSPDAGLASSDLQNITITVLGNEGMDRTADIVFSIGMATRTLTVNQDGPGGSVEDLVVYSNDFDKEEAIKGDSWQTYLDSFTGWMNETGSGIADVTYGFDRITARTNSANGSGGTHSVYAGSGMNYLWFGSGAPYFAVKNIMLPEGQTDFTLSFGTERYEYGKDDNTFNFSEFGVYLSADAKKWVRLTCDFAGGKLPNGKWDLASYTFSVPEGTSALNVYFASSVPSAYAIDDLSLVISAEEGTALDFASGEEFEIGDVETGGGDDDGDDDEQVTKPESLTKVTIAEFLEASVSSDVWYELTGKITDIAKEDYGNFTIEDETGEVYIYGMTNGWVGSNDKSFSEIGLKVGDTVTLGTLRGEYKGTPQGGGNPVPAYYISHVAGEGGDEGGEEGGDEGDEGGEEGGDEGGDVEIITIAEFLAADISDVVQYTVKGVITNIESINTEYQNATLTISDETGSLYIYRMKEDTGAGIENLGLTVADELTVRGCRGEYYGSPQMVDGVYVSHIDNEAPADDYDATIVFAECGYTNAQIVDGETINIDENVTAVFSTGGASTAPTYYDSGSAIRMYQNGALLDITATGKTITGIELVFASNHYYLAADSGELSAEGPTRVWTGSAESVRFTSTGTDKNHRAYISAIKVKYE